MKILLSYDNQSSQFCFNWGIRCACLEAAEEEKREGQISIGLTQVWKFTAIKALRAKLCTHPSLSVSGNWVPIAQQPGKMAGLQWLHRFLEFHWTSGVFYGIMKDKAKPEQSERYLQDILQL